MINKLESMLPRKDFGHYPYYSVEHAIQQIKINPKIDLNLLVKEILEDLEEENKNLVHNMYLKLCSSKGVQPQ